MTSVKKSTEYKILSCVSFKIRQQVVVDCSTSNPTGNVLCSLCVASRKLEKCIQFRCRLVIWYNELNLWLSVCLFAWKIKCLQIVLLFWCIRFELSSPLYAAVLLSFFLSFSITPLFLVLLEHDEGSRILTSLPIFGMQGGDRWGCTGVAALMPNRANCIGVLIAP